MEGIMRRSGERDRICTAKIMTESTATARIITE